MLCSWYLSVVTYNCQHLHGRSHKRITDIINELIAHLLGLPSTGIQTLKLHKDLYTKRNIKDSFIIDFATGAQGYSNRPCGCSLVNGKVLMRVFSSSNDIVGRVGGARFKSASYDLCPIVAYYPMENCSAHIRKIIDCINSWIIGVLLAFPARCTPLICTDMNGKLGEIVFGNDNGENAAVGNNESRTESPQGRLIRIAPSSTPQDVVFANTFTAGGGHPSYFSAKRRPRIYFISVAQNLLLSMDCCYKLRRGGYRLQLNKKTPQNRNHCPIICKFSCRLWFADPHGLSKRADINDMMRAWMFAGKFAEYVSACRASFTTVLEKFIVLKHDPDKLYLLLQDTSGHVSPSSFHFNELQQRWQFPELSVLRSDMREFRERLRENDVGTDEGSEEELANPVVNEVKELDKKIGRCKCKGRDNLRKKSAINIEKPANAQDWKAVWGESRAVACRGLGQTCRRFDVVLAKPNIEQWEEHMQQRRPDGGQDTKTIQQTQEGESIALTQLMQNLPIRTDYVAQLDAELTAGDFRAASLPSACDRNRFEFDDIITLSKADQECRMCLIYLRYSKARKTGPPFAAAREPWLLGFCRPHHLDERLGLSDISQTIAGQNDVQHFMQSYP